MKVLVISTLFTVLSGASAGSAVAWPGARDVSAQPVLAGPAVVNTLVPQTKVFGFSTTQYINAVPSAAPIAFQPQVHYQVPQLGHFAPVQHTAFYPVAGGSYFPSNVYYPPFAIAPSAPGYPVTQIIPGSEQPPQSIPGFPQGTPSYPTQGIPSQDQPSQDAGDADTAVVDSADFPQQQDQDQKQDQPQDKPQEPSMTTEAPQQNEPAAPQFPPAGNFPSLPQTPSFPSLPQFPQGSIPQFPQGGQAPAFPSFPQFPQGDEQPSFPLFPQFPQGSLPQFPQLPQFPSNPSYPQSPTATPPSSFPGAGDSEGEKGLNDEDTISVESA